MNFESVRKASTLASAMAWVLVALLRVSALETDRGAGEASYQFLKLPLSPRVTALSGAGVALWNGGGEAESNPASAAQDSSRLVFGYGLPFGQFGARASHFAWNHPLETSRLWFGLRYLGYDAITGHSENDVVTTDYGAHTWKAQAGYAFAWQGLDIGLALGYAQNHVADATYATGLANVGLAYRLWQGLSLGAAVTQANFYTSDAREAGAEAPFPPTVYQAGLAYAQALPGSVRAAVVVDARTRNDETLAFPAGLEANWNQWLTVRLGYPFGSPTGGLTAGLGVDVSRFRVQYAYEGHETLDAGHFLSLEIAY